MPGRRGWWLLPIGVLACAGPGTGTRQTVEVELPHTGLWTGRADAPLALIEFGSHGCAGCWRFALEGFPLLDREFVRPGLLRYRYVDVSPSPLSALVECQAALLGVPEARASVYRYLRDTAPAAIRARSGSVPVPPECLADSAAESRRRREADVARRARVPGTPTFLIGRAHPDGRIVGWVEIGFTDADSLAAVVRAALKLRGEGP
jgi:protein-disulfide isomerase